MADFATISKKYREFYCICANTKVLVNNVLPKINHDTFQM